MRRNILRNKKAMSIVISTIIIAAIAITMAIAVSFWAMGISNAFTKFEKIEIISAYVSDTQVAYTRVGPSPMMTLNCFAIYMTLKNTGTNTATIANVFLDGKPYTATSTRVQGGQIAYVPGLYPSNPLQTGQSMTGNIFLPVNTGTTPQPLWNSGEFITIELETAAGRHYAYTVVIP